jgi:hypothetical protein
MVSLEAHSQSGDAVCENGVGSFSAISNTGVSVYVGSQKTEGFGTRDCMLSLGFKGATNVVVSHAWQLDVDAMGVDLGLGTPVLALATKATDTTRFATYQLYSLKGVPHLIREITGSDSYSAKDSDLDGQINIWAHDSVAVDGFDDIPLASFDFPPTVVLRFEKRRLIDVSADFQETFDQQIALMRSRLNPEDLHAFKSSDGLASQSGLESKINLHRLLMAKVAVLEIVFAYLYSGREEEAWKTLTELWPSVDFERVRAAIIRARTTGLLHQVEEIKQFSKRSQSRHQSPVYSAPPEKTNESKASLHPPIPIGLGDMEAPAGSGQNPSASFVADTGPIAIHLYMSQTENEGSASLDDRRMVHLLIDESGKVHSIRFDGQPIRQIQESVSGWRFIPAYKFGRAVACTLDYYLSVPK